MKNIVDGAVSFAKRWVRFEWTLSFNSKHQFLTILAENTAVIVIQRHALLLLNSEPLHCDASSVSDYRQILTQSHGTQSYDHPWKQRPTSPRRACLTGGCSLTTTIKATTSGFERSKLVHTLDVALVPTNSLLSYTAKSIRLAIIKHNQ